MGWSRVAGSTRQATIAVKLAKVHGSLGSAGLFRAVGLSFGSPDPVASLKQLGD